jgi:geranylgeranyl reductase family protein
MTVYDVAIIGGGPAGATLGNVLSRQGLKITVIDRAQFPREKLCGGLLTWKSIRLLEQTYNLRLNDLLKSKIICFSSDKLKLFLKNEPLGLKTVKDKLYFTKRRRFDDFLLKIVEENGGHLHLNTSFEKISFENARYKIQTDKGFLKASYVVGADGVNSIIRRNYVFAGKMRQRWVKNLGLAVESVIPMNQVPDRLSCPILSYGYLNRGYGWIFPDPKGLVVGCGGLLVPNKGEFIKALAALASDFSLPIHRINGHGVPFGNYLERPYRDGIFLVGDAGGFVDPFTGEGIYYALRTAQLLGAAMGSCFENLLEIQSSYKRLLKSFIVEELKYAHYFRNFFYSLMNPRFFNLIRSMHHLWGHLVIELIQGRRSYKLFRQTAKMVSPIFDDYDHPDKDFSH